MDHSAHNNTLAQVANYLAARREAILNTWRTACSNDQHLKNNASLSRQEFNNRVPFMLDELEHRLLGHEETQSISLLATEHGLHRWQKGYVLQELLVEMQYLNDILLEQLRLLWEFDPSISREVMVAAYEHIARFSSEITSSSVQQYSDLQRQSAISRVEALEKTLTQLNELTQQRSNLLHRSSHDLRGSFGIIEGAVSLLEMAEGSAEERKQFLDILQRNLANSQALITQLIDLSRLEAGHEPVTIQSVNVGRFFTSIVEDYQVLAQERGLLLHADGPAELTVESDPILLQRIIQNLVLNALKHTEQGYVSVSWMQENESRWTVSVQDSGPGLPNVSASGSLSSILAPSEESAAAFGFDSPVDETKQAADITAVVSTFSHKGEGIGLSIVKGLCELLRANLEIESKPGSGTLFRIRSAVHWRT